MSTNVTFNGVSYAVPAQGESNWGTNVSNYLIAIASGALQKTGGTFTLTADVDFGASYGLKAMKFSSRSTPSTTGIVRLGNNESVAWRNAANSADLAFKVNASNVLEFNGNPMLTLALGTANYILKMNSGGTAYEWGELADANIAAAAAIARSKIAVGTADHVLINSGAGAMSSEATLSKSRGGAGADMSSVTFPSSGTIATIAGTQVLTNKDIDGGTASNTSRITLPSAAKATLDALTRKEGTIVYATDDDKAYIDNGVDLLAVGSGGAAGRNYLSDWFDATKSESVGTSAATSTGNRTVVGNTDPTKWVTSDLTNLTFARSASTTLRQAYNYLINSGDANADFVESPLFTLDGVDLGKPVTVSFDCAGVSASDDYQVCAVRYDSSGTYQEVIRIAGTASATTPYSARLPVGTTSFQGFFVAGSTSTDQYAIRFMKHAVNVDLRIDSIYVGPQSVVQGAAVTDWVSFTPTGSWSTNATYTGKWRQVGDSMECEIYIALSGAPTGTLSALNLPSGYTIDTAKLNQSTTNKDSIGRVGIQAAGTANYIGTLAYSSTTAVRPFIINAAGTYAVDASITATAPATFANGDFVSAHFKVPIVGWSSNVTMANRAVEEYSFNSGTWDAGDSTTFGYGLAGGTMDGGLSAGGRTKRVRFTTPAQANDHIELLVTDGTTYLPALQFADTSNNRIVNGKMADGTNVGFLVKRVSGSTTDFDVFFHQYAAAANDDAPAQNWINGWKWVLKKTSGGASVGFPVSTANIVGRTDGLTVGSGYIGQVIEPSSALVSYTITTSEADVTNASIALTPGVWQICYSLTVEVATGASSGNSSYARVMVTNAANTHIGKTERILQAKATAAVSNSIDASLSASCVVNISADTTYKLRAIRIDSAGTGTSSVYVSSGNYESTFYAVRIA